MVNLTKPFKQRVYDLLRTCPETKDNDQYLYALILNADLLIAGYEPKELPAHELFKLMKAGKVSNPESVRRMRQKLQEEYENLRGASYKHRQRKAQDVRVRI